MCLLLWQDGLHFVFIRPSCLRLCIPTSVPQNCNRAPPQHFSLHHSNGYVYMIMQKPYACTSVCMHVCMYARIYVYVRICISSDVLYICINIDIHTHVHTYTHMCKLVFCRGAREQGWSRRPKLLPGPTSSRDSRNSSRATA